ncbi:hypothetical protein CEP52_015738 [Fusarium oligoseptatum]|uniref:Uncharacterized protein n=1 Tax=Fusarium oligoseptatum TaxID=2604345 RepID=A0A428SAG2_9HYPO|nr:hypothetical protein CEP52_015738 [Fusarium oligoseptatum]
MTQSACHNSTQSLDKMVQPGQVGSQVQQPATGSPTVAFRPDARPATGRIENNTRDDLPLSPVSQVSNMGPPSVSSIATGQSPRLTTSGPAMGRRQSSQLSQPSVPNTPALSMASHTPPTQNQPFSTRMGMSPQQQHQQQFPPGFQHQAINPQQGVQQNVPGQQQPGGFRGQSSPHPSSLAPGRPSMQMQHSVGPQVPPKDTMGPPPQPYATEAPRQGSPASSKWKGLRNRMSGQAAHKPSPSQSKPEGEKLSASKILGAFKRSSKVPQQAPAQSFQGGFQGGFQGYHGAQQQQQFPGQPPYGQTPTPRQSSQFGSPPVGQMQTPRQSSQQFSSPPVGQMQTPRQSSQFTSPSMGQHQFQRPSGPVSQGQPGMGQPYPGYGFKPQGQFQSPPQPQGQFQSPLQHQGQFHSPPQAQGQFQSPPRPQDRFPSPPLPQGQFESPPQRHSQVRLHSPPQHQGQFQSPPQPQGQWQTQTHSPGGQFVPSPYQPGQFPTQGQGMAGQSPNRTHPSPRVQQGHMMQQSIHQQQQPITVQQSVPIQQPIPVHAPSPHQGALLQQFMPPAANIQPNNAEYQGNRAGQPSHPAFAHRGSPANTNQQGRPDMQRLVSNDSHHSGGSSGSSRLGSNPPPAVQYTSPRMVTGENEATKPLPPAGGVPVVAATAAGASPAGGQPGVTTNENSVPKTEEHRALSLSPPSGSNGEISPVNSALLSQPTPEPKGTINAAPVQKRNNTRQGRFTRR